MLKITQSKGFQITFANGWTVSVQFGAGNYCERRNADFGAPRTCDQWESSDAEIAAWDANGTLFHFDHDDVKGYMNANEVAKFISKIESM